MQFVNPIAIRNLLTDDILSSIFDKVNIVHRKRLSRVCERWKRLIDVTFFWVTEFSAVDDRKCVADWHPANWIGLKFASAKDYIRIPKVSVSEIMAKMSVQLPNLTAIDLECCDMNNRTIRTILDSCKMVERINFDSSTRLNFYSFNLMVREWTRLRHINLSCCIEVNEVSARFLIQNLKWLESLNLCGTKINGPCLELLGRKIKRLDISYCWNVQGDGLRALSRASCRDLEELCVNNFDFDGAESCLIDLLKNFAKLKHLQMSIGPCVTHDFFIDRITTRGFSAIGGLHDLETLIIERVCIMDNACLFSIMKNCRKLKCIRLNLGWLNHCNDVVFASIDTLLPDLEELHISYPASLTCAGAAGFANLKKLRALSLINTQIDNEIFRYISKLQHLTEINLDENRKITQRGLSLLCRIANRRPDEQIHASLLGSGIPITRVRSKKNYPTNLIAQISSFRATKYQVQLPFPVINL